MSNFYAGVSSAMDKFLQSFTQSLLQPPGVQRHRERTSLTPALNQLKPVYTHPNLSQMQTFTKFIQSTKSTSIFKLLFVVLSCAVFSISDVKSQASLYSFASSTGSTLETIISPTSITTVSSGSADDGFIAVSPGSFSFTFNAINYTTFNVATNGYLTFGTTTPSTTIPSSLATHTGSPGVYVFGRDGNLNVSNGGAIVHGAAAGGKYVFQHTNYSGGGSGAESSTSLLTYQIVLWGPSSASPGRIEVIYGTSIGTPSTAGTVGIRDIANTYRNGADNSTTTTATLSAWPSAGTRHTYTPPPPCVVPTAQATDLVVAATAGSSTSITGSFTASSPASNAYLVVRTTTNIPPTPPVNGTTYTVGASALGGVIVANGPSTSFVATGLTASTTYFFWIYSSSGQCTGSPQNSYFTASPLTGSATTNTPVAPSTCASIVAPLNASFNVPYTQTLSWNAVTGVPLPTYDVYLGTNQSLVTAEDVSVRVSTGSSNLTFTPTLASGTTYYWKVVPTNTSGRVAGCPVNVFSTAPPAPPVCNTTFTPVSGATNLLTTQTLSWSGASSETQYPIFAYDVYLGTDFNAVSSLSSATRVATNITGTSLSPSYLTYLLAPGTTYFWTVVSKNSIGSSTGCVVNSFTVATPTTRTSTARGGLWNDAGTWAGGVVPAANDIVTIADGATVSINTAVTVSALNIGTGGSNTATLQWSTTNSLTVVGNITIASNGRLLPYTSATGGQTINVGGNFTNNGYTNLAVGSTVLNFNGSQQGGGSSSQVLGGSGVFEADASGIGIIRSLFFQTSGSSSITTSQNLVAYTLQHTAGSLNTGGKLTVSNAPVVYGRPINRQVANIVVTAMGSGYTATPVVSAFGAALWVASTSVSLGNIRIAGNNVYVVTVGGTTGTVAPTHTSDIATNGTATLLWVGNTGTIGLPFGSFGTTPAAGAQYFIGTKLFTATSRVPVSLTATQVRDLAVAASALTTVGTIAAVNTDTLQFIGTAAQASANYENTGAGAGTIRSLTITNAGSGYYTTAPTLSILASNGAGTGAVATAIFFQQIAAPANSSVVKSPVATISGGLTIKSDQQVGAVLAGSGGLRYTGTPRVGFPLPSNFTNLMQVAGSRPGSGYTAAPTTFRIAGGTRLPNSTNPTFTAVVARGRVISVICTGGGTGWLTQPDSIKFATSAGTDSAVVMFPPNALAQATPVLTNGTITGFTVTNGGVGYASAPTPTLDSTGGVGTAAATLTSTVGLYNLTYNYLAPATSNNEATTGIEIPSNNRINILTLGSTTSAQNFAKVKLNADLELYAGSGAIGLQTGTSYGSVLNLNGKTLNFSNPQYAGTGTTGAATNAVFGYVGNGSIRIALPGTSATGKTITFPFDAPLAIATGGSATPATTGATLTGITVTQVGKPTASNPGSRTPIGNRAWLAVADTLTGVSPFYGTSPTVTLTYNSNDSLISSLQQQFLRVGQSDSLTGTWITRGAAVGGTSILAVPTGSVTSAIATPGPIAPSVTGRDFFGFTNEQTPPTITGTYGPYCSGGGETVTITGTGFTNVSAVQFNGVNAASFTVNSATSITAVTPSGITAGRISVTATGAVGTSSSDYSITSTGVFAETLNPTNALICSAGGSVSISLNDIGASSYLWTGGTGPDLDTRTGLNVVASPSVSTNYTVSAVFGSCTVTKTFSVGVLASASIVPTATPAASCFVNGATVSLNSNLSAGNFSVASVTYSPATAPATARFLVDRGVSTTDYTYTGNAGLDDGGWQGIPIGFTYNFFGNFYNNIAVGTNGVLMFGTVPGFTSTAGQLGQYIFNTTGGVFPNFNNPGNIIAAFASDQRQSTATSTATCTTTSGSAIVTLASGTTANYVVGDSISGTGIPAGTLIQSITNTTTFVMTNAATASGSVSVTFNEKPIIRYWTEGTAPTRRFILEYFGSRNYDVSGARSFVQCMLYETSGIVEIHVRRLAAGTGNAAKTIGLQDATKTIGAVAPGRQFFTNGVTTSEAWRFSPPTNYIYAWKPSAGINDTTLSAPTYTVTSPGTKNVSLVVTNPVTGCITTTPLSFLVSPTPTTPTVTGTLTVCGSGSTALFASAPGAGNRIRWYSAANAGTLLATGSLFVTPVIDSTTTYYVAEENALCASPRRAVIVTVAAPPTFTVTDRTVCSGTASVNLTVNSNTSFYDTYIWSPTTDLFLDEALLVPYTGQSATSVFVRATTNAFQRNYICTANSFESLCGTRDTATVTIQPPAVSIASSNPICISGSTVLSLTSATPIAKNSVQWQVSTTSSTSGFTDVVGAITDTLQTGTISATRYYRAIIKNELGATCTTTDVFTLTANNPQVTGTTPANRCGAGAVTLSATPADGNIKWYTALTGGSSVKDSSAYTIASLSSTTTYYVSLTVNGCEGTRTAVTATVATPSPVTLTSGGTICNGTILPLSVTSTLSDFDSYVWSPTTGLFTDAAATIPYTGGSATTLYFRNTTAGTYTYTVSANNSVNLCTNNASTSVTVLPGAITISPATTSICRTGTASFNISPAAGYGSGILQWQSSTTSPTAGFTNIAGENGTTYSTGTLSAVGTTYYRIVLTDGTNTCVTASASDVTVSNPQVTGSTGATRCGPGAVTLTASTATGTINWYSTNTSTTVLGTGTSFTTPSISSTRSYFAAAVENGCIGTRTAVTATISTAPAFTLSTNSQSLGCDATSSAAIDVTSTLSDFDSYTWTASAPGILYTDAAATTPYVAGTNATSIFVKTAVAGNYTITALASNSTTNCSNTALSTVIVSTATPITLSSASQVVCNDGIAAISVTSTLADYDSYVWTPATGLFTDAAATIPYVAGTSATTVYARSTVAGTTVYTVSGSTGASACVGTATSSVAVQPAAATVSASVSTICRTGSGVITLNYTGSFAAGTIQWQRSTTSSTSGFVDINGSTSDTLQTGTVTTTTHYRVQIKDGTGAVCFSTTAATVTVNNPTVASTAPGSRCGTGAVVLGATPSAGATISWFASLSGGNALATGNTYTTPSITSNTNYFVSAAIGTCVSTPRVSVAATISSSPTVTLTPSQTVCNNTITALSVTSNTSDYDSYVWAPVTGLFTDVDATVPYTGGTATTVYFRRSTVGSTTYTVSATNSVTFCSFNTASTTVTVQPASASLAASVTSICASGTSVLTLTPSTGYASSSIQWRVSTNAGVSYADTTAAGTVTSLTTSTLGATRTYLAQVKNSAGAVCFSTNAVTVNVSNPQVSGTTPATRCGTGTVTLGATSAGGDVLNWYAAATGGSSLGTGVSFTTPVISTTTTYFVGRTVSGCEGIRTPVVATVTPALPLTVAPITQTVCNNVLSAPIAVTSTASNYDSYVWTPTSGLFTDAVGTPYTTGASATTVYVRTTAPGVQVYTLTATNSATGCVSILRDTVRVQPATATISSNPTSICVSGTATLSLSSATLFASGTTQWQESSGAGFADISGSTATTYTTPSNTTTKSYQVVVKDGTGATCFTTAPATVTYNNPTVTLAASNISRCGPGTITLTASAAVGTVNWYTNAAGGSPVATGNSYTIPFLAGTTTYYVSATDNGCEGVRVPDTATISAPPTLTLPSDQIVCNGAVTPLSILSNVSDYESYTWSPATNLFTDAAGTIPYVANTSASTVYARSSVAGSITYTVSASNATSGCSASGTVSLSVQPGAATVTSVPANLCLSGSATLSLNPATGYAPGTIQWQRSSNNISYIDIPAAIGTTLTTPFQATTRFYRALIKDGTGAVCFTTATNTLVVNNPSITAFSTGTLCSSAITTLTAAASAGATINWYNSPTTTTVAGTGNSFTPPVSASSVTYYAQAVVGSCVSGRVQSVTVRPTPVILTRTATPSAICSGESVVLAATTSTTTAHSWTWTNNSTTVLTTNTGTINPVNLTNAPVTATYYVVARDTSAALCASATDSVTVTINPAPVTPVAQPASITLTPATTSVTIDFAPATGNPGGYLVVRSATQPNAPINNTTYTASATLNATLNGTVVGVGLPPFTDNFGVTTGTSYTYWVYAFNGGGTSCGTILYLTSIAPATASTTTCGLPPVASAATAVSGNGFTANWAAVAGATGYQVDVATSSAFSAGTFVTGYNSLVVSDGSTTSAIITGLNPATAYFYRVRAVTGSCVSSNSGTQTVTTYYTIPWIETFSTATSAPTGWTASSSTIGTLINGAGNSSIYVNLWSSNATNTFTLPIFTPVPSGNLLSYQYSVMNYNSGSQPTTFTGAGWGSFQLQVSTNFGSSWTNLGSPVTAATPGGYVTNNVDISAYAGAAANVSFRIVSSWTTGDYYLNFDNFSILAPCVTPTTQSGNPTAVAASSGSINASFTAAVAPGATSYLVLRTPAGVQPSVAPVNGTSYVAGATLGNAIVTSVGRSTSFAATGLVPSTTYRFTVYAYNDSCNGGAPFYNRTSPASAELATTAPVNFVSNGSGLWSQPATWIPVGIPSINDSVTIQNGHTVTIDIAAVAARLAINNSGTLQYDGIAARSLTVAGDVIVNAGGNFIAAAAGSTSTVTTNSLLLAGSLTNNGNIDFSTTAGAGGAVANATGVNITFNGVANSTLSGSGTTDLRGLVINEGSAANVVDITAPFSVQGATTDGASMGFVTLTQGILKFSGTQTIASRLFASANYTIPATAGIWLNNPNFTVAGQNGTATNNGTFRLTSGTYNVGTAVNNSFTAGTGAIFNIEGGALNVAGSFTSANNVNYTQSAGTVTVATVGNSTNTTPSFGFTSAAVANTFTMSGGTIVLQRASTATTPYDYRQIGGTVNISGGTVRFGNASTPAASTFLINAVTTATINTPGIVVDNTTTTKTLSVVGSAPGVVRVAGDLTINSGSSLVHNTSAADTISIVGNSTSAGNLINNGAIAVGASSVPGNRIAFASTSGAQSYTGAGTLGTSIVGYAGIIVNNTAGVTFGQTGANAIINSLGLLTGPVTGANKIQLGTGATATLQRGGIATATAGSLDVAPNFNVSATGLTVAYEPSAASVTTDVELLSSVGTLSINNTNGVTLSIPVSTTSLALTSGKLFSDAVNIPTVTGTAVSNITRGTGFVSGPMRITLPSGATSSAYVLPVGKTSYAGFELINPVTTSVTVVDAEYNEGPSGGQPINFMASLYDGYWSSSVVSGALSTTRVRVTSPTVINGTTDGLARSDGSNNGFDGFYDLIGTVNSSAVTLASNPTPLLTGLGYFAIGAKAIQMSYIASTAVQVTGNAFVGAVDQPILRIAVFTANNFPALTATRFKFSSAGTTLAGADLSGAKLYYTGNSSTFATASQFDGLISPVPDAPGEFEFFGGQELVTGVNYFWLAYDVSSNATPGNVIDATFEDMDLDFASVQTDIITGGTTVIPITTTNPAGNRTILPLLNGTYSVGSGNVSGEAGHFNTLTAAVTALNTSAAIGGPVTFVLTDNSYTTATGETFPIVINQFDFASSINTLTIKPNTGVTATISGSSSSALIRLNGADYVVIDGSNSGTNSRNLTITNTSTASSTAAIWLSSLGANAGATNNTIKNCIVNTGTTSSATMAITVQGGTLSTTGGGEDNDNNTIQNNQISAASIGIYAVGVAGNVNDNLQITGNVVSYTGSLASTGIELGHALGAAVSGNTVSSSTSVSGSPVGISIEDGVAGTFVNANTIAGVATSATGGYGGRGITIATGLTNSNLTVSNNMIYGINGSNFSSFGNSSAMGIAVGVLGTSSTLTSVAGGVKLYYNTVNMTGNHSYTSATITAALYVGSAVTTLDVRNNIFVNALNNTGTTGSKSYAVYSAAANSAFSAINNNNYFGGGSQGVLGFLGSDRTTLAAWQSATGADANSKNVSPTFISATDLHLSAVNTVNVTNFVAAGAPVSIITDFDSETRSSTAPTIGADELVPCDGAFGGTAVAPAITTFCGSSTAGVTITASGYSSALGGTYQWQSAPDAAGPFTNIAGATNPAAYVVATPVTTTTYYRLRVTCTSGQSVATSNVVALTIIAAPTSTVTSTGGNVFCTPLPGTITLNGTTDLVDPVPQYQWFRNGVAATGAGNNTATYTVPTGDVGVYNLRVTNPVTGCVGTSADLLISSSPRPTVTASATPSTLCVGQSLTLANVSAASGPYNVSSGAYSLVDMTGATVLVSGGVNASSANFNGGLDDGGWSNIALPFSFTFFGNSYSQVGIGTNGNIQFGATSTVNTSYPGSTGANNGLLPSTIINNFIAGPWTDITFSTSGTIRYRTVGTAPNRRFVVDYNGPVLGGSDNVTSQIVLNEGTNVVQVYLDQFNNNVPKPFSVGIQGTGTNFAAAPGRNAVTVSTPSEAWVFTPNSIASYSWTGAGSFSSSLSSPTINSVSLANTGTYSVTVTDAVGCTQTASTPQVTVNQNAITGVTGSQTICQGGTPTALSVTAVGPGLSYQWFSNSTASNTGGTSLGTGASSATYTPSTATPGTFYYYCVVTGTCGVLTSDVLTVTVNANTVITAAAAPASQTVFINDPSPAPITIGATGSGITYQWFVNTVNSNVGGVSVGTSGQGATFTPPTNALGLRYYYCVVSGICGTLTSGAVAVTVTNTNTWKGNGTTDWSTGSNWTLNVPPGATNDAVIPIGNTPYPILSTSTTVNNLVIDGGATVEIGPNTFTIGGAISGTGTLTGSATSSLALNATTTVRFTQTNAATRTLKNLNVNAGTVTLANALDITGGVAINTYGTVTVATGASLVSNGNLTIRSNQFGTARVATGATSGNYILGDVTVERYIPANARRAWRMLSVPTQGNQKINAAWQEGAAGVTVNPVPGYGTLITTGVAGTILARGFDLYTPKASIQTYNAATNSFVDVTATLGAGTVGNIATRRGYALFIRGDRGSRGQVSQADTITSPTVLRTRGPLYTGDQPALSVAANQFEMIGNTYASAVDFLQLAKTGLSSTFYIWDPKASTGISLGAYQTFNPINDYKPLLPGSYGLGTPASPFISNTVIESGQAFFVTAGATGGSIAMVEAAKTAGSGLNMFRPTGGIRKIKTNLYKQLNGTEIMADANIAAFADGFSNDIDGDDATKMANGAENLGILRNNATLVIEARQPIVDADTTVFKMWNMNQTQYRLEFVPTEMNVPGLTAFLQDRFTGTTTPINLSATTNYNFTVTAQAASAAADRFRIVYKQVQSGPLPVSFVSISANKVGAAVKVDWKVAAERSIRTYEIERSVDGANFTSIGNVAAAGNNSNDFTYSFNDASPLTGTGYYRIKSIGFAGDVKFSYIAKVFVGSVKPAFVIAPNPVEDGVVNIQFKNQAPGRYNLRLMNPIGQVVFTTVTTHAGGNGNQQFELPATIARGSYQMEIIAPDKTREVQTLFINTRK